MTKQIWNYRGDEYEGPIYATTLEDGTIVEEKVKDSIYAKLFVDGTLILKNSNDISYKNDDGNEIEVLEDYENIFGKEIKYEEDKDGNRILVEQNTIGWISKDEWNIEKNNKVKKVIIQNLISPKSTAYWFSYMVNLENIEGLNNLDTSRVTSMAGMFYSCSSLTSLDLPFYFTNKLTDMNSMFKDCIGLTSIDLMDISAEKVKDMGYMFSGCSNLSEINIAGFLMTNVKDVSSIFYNVPVNAIIIVKSDKIKEYFTNIDDKHTYRVAKWQALCEGK